MENNEIIETKKKGKAGLVIFCLLLIIAGLVFYMIKE